MTGAEKALARSRSLRDSVGMSCFEARSQAEREYGLPHGSLNKEYAREARALRKAADEHRQQESEKLHPNKVRPVDKQMVLFGWSHWGCPVIR